MKNLSFTASMIQSWEILGWIEICPLCHANYCTNASAIQETKKTGVWDIESQMIENYGIKQGRGFSKQEGKTRKIIRVCDPCWREKVSEIR